MGNTAELVLERYGEEYNLTREDMDEFAYNSHMRAIKAIKEGKFKDQIVPMPYTTWKNGKKVEGVLTEDEGPRPDTTPEGLGEAPPCLQTRRRSDCGQQLADERRARPSSWS